MSTEPQDFRVRLYQRQLGRIVADLRDLADRVEREGKPMAAPGVTGTPRYLAAAEAVNRTITWGLANASPYRLFDAACHADIAEREASTQPASSEREGQR